MRDCIGLYMECPDTEDNRFFQIVDEKVNNLGEREFLYRNIKTNTTDFQPNQYLRELRITEDVLMKMKFIKNKYNDHFTIFRKQNIIVGLCEYSKMFAYGKCEGFSSGFVGIRTLTLLDNLERFLDPATLENRFPFNSEKFYGEFPQLYFPNKLFEYANELENPDDLVIKYYC